MRKRLTFSYDYGQVYLYDAARAWREDNADVYLEALADAESRGHSVGAADGLIDLLMVRPDNPQAPLELEVHDDAPPADLDAWDHVEFPLDLPSGSLSLEPAGGSVERSIAVPFGHYAARWSARHLDAAVAWDRGDSEAEGPPDEHRLELWPVQGRHETRELKRSRHYAAAG